MKYVMNATVYAIFEIILTSNCRTKEAKPKRLPSLWRTIYEA